MPSLKLSLVTVAVAAGLLAAAGPASAGTQPSGLVAYNGHAGLGITDGTSNTIMFGERLVLMPDMGGQLH